MKSSDMNIKMKISSLIDDINQSIQKKGHLQAVQNFSFHSKLNRSGYMSPQTTPNPKQQQGFNTPLQSKTLKPQSNLSKQLNYAYQQQQTDKIKFQINRPPISPSISKPISDRRVIHTKATSKVQKFKTQIEEIQQKISLYSRKNRLQQPVSQHKSKLITENSLSPLRPLIDQKSRQCKDLFFNLKKKMFKETVSTTVTQFLKHENSIQDFTLGRLLGEGKFSKVYLSRHSKSGMIFAMKIIKKSTIFQQKFQGQLARQIVIQSFFNHVNLVRLYGYFHDQKNVYLVQQYCPSGQLYDIFKVKSKLKEQEWRPIMKGICEGIYILHLNDVIHRDLKPQNIMLAFGLPKIGDFGWAVYSPRDRRDTFCGTPLYISPELLLGGSYDKQVDIWALGVMTFQFLTGRIPFKIDQQKKLLQIVNSKIQIPLSLSQSCRQLLSMILNKDPQSRIAILDVLQHYFLGSTLTSSLSQAFFFKK